MNNILVLDIIDGHNTGACILRNGEIEYVASEERISSDFDCMSLEHIHHHIRSTRRQSKSRTLKYPVYRYPPILFVISCILPCSYCLRLLWRVCHNCITQTGSKHVAGQVHGTVDLTSCITCV